MKETIYYCLHGHFYQPPRENPWIETIEPQESARPFHDWNERIYQECYFPNAKARVLDEKGRVLDIVNNYKKMSFNFGPTLFAWLADKHPETYQEILVADKISAEQNSGHGNAIAQVYNHMILPLANTRDKVTQVRWGVEEFRFRFKRDPESIWLAETACNEDTLEVLIEEGMKFLILAPHQADSVRPLSGGEWKNVGDGSIDPRQAYRVFSKKHPQKYIDLFFYDGPIAKAAGFENILYDAKVFMNRLKSAAVLGGGNQLISIATDGETFGHHKAFGERVIAYLMNVEAPKHHFQVINFGKFLEMFPPVMGARIKPGEGTSWSCIHGIARWKEHCGCRGDGPGEWTQHWRGPLREALDWLRDECAKIYEEYGGKYFKDVWQARNDYIHVVLNREEKNVQAFYERQALKACTKTERIESLKLLEMQRHTLLMYTSCGWFFTELSGIETLQVMEYAARAVELAQQISGRQLEADFLEKLSKAKSNIPEFKDGRALYEKRVQSQRVSLSQAASFFAMRSLIDEAFSSQESRLYCFKIQILHQRRESFGDMTVYFGRMKITSVVCEEEADLVFMAIHMGLYDFRCSIKPFSNQAEIEQLEKSFLDELHALHLVELMRMIDRAFGEKYFSLKDLPLEQRMEIIKKLTREMIDKINQALEHLFDENRRMSEIYRLMNLPIPEEIRYAAEHTLKRRMEAAIQDLGEAGFNPKKAGGLQRVIENGNSFGINLLMTDAGNFLNAELSKRTQQLAQKPSEELVAECLNILKIAKKIKVELDQGRAQEYLFHLIKKWIINPKSMPASLASLAEPMLQLITELHIYPDEFKTMMHLSGAKS